MEIKTQLAAFMEIMEIMNQKRHYKYFSKCVTCEIVYPVYKTRCDVCHLLIRHRPRSKASKAKYSTGGRY